MKSGLIISRRSTRVPPMSPGSVFLICLLVAVALPWSAPASTSAAPTSYAYDVQVQATGTGTNFTWDDPFTPRTISGSLNASWTATYQVGFQIDEAAGTAQASLAPTGATPNVVGTLSATITEQNDEGYFVSCSVTDLPFGANSFFKASSLEEVQSNYTAGRVPIQWAAPTLTGPNGGSVGTTDCENSEFANPRTFTPWPGIVPGLDYRSCPGSGFTVPINRLGEPRIDLSSDLTTTCDSGSGWGYTPQVHYTIVLTVPCPAAARQPQAFFAACAKSDVAVTKTGPKEISTGERIKYQMKIKNGGPSTASDVALTDQWDVSLAEFDTASSGCTFSTRVVCALGSIRAGESRNVTVELIAQKPGQLVNTATATTSSIDPNGSNNTGAFTTVIGEPELFGLEVTQAIADLRGRVPMIRNRKTFVRAHVKAGALEEFDGTAQLVGIDPTTGVELGAIAPINRAFEQKPGFIRVLKSPFRSDIDHSFLFQLPDSWTDPYRRLAVRFEGVGRKYACKAQYGGTLGTCTATFDLIPEPRLDIRFVPISWTSLQRGGTLIAPTARRDGPLAIRQIKSVFPMGDSGLTWEWAPTTYHTRVAGPPNQAELFAHLANIRRVRLFDGCLGSCKTLYFGIVPYPTSAADTKTSLTAFGAAFSPLGGGVAGIAYLADEPHLLAISHELAHLLQGNAHAKCNGDEGDVDPIYPYAKGLISNFSTTDPDSNYYGLNANTSALPLVVDPRSAGDVTSYCTHTWVSDYTYNRMYNAMKERFGLVTASALAATTGSLVVSGTVSPDGSQGTIDEVVALESPAAPSVSGAYALRVKDAAGTTLGTYPFEPLAVEDETLPMAILESIPRDTAAASIEILRGDQVIGAREASPAAPVIELEDVGAVLDAPLDLGWSATDADGDQLNFIVQYSADGGASWTTLATDLSKPLFEIEPSGLEATNDGRLRVISSDGFNSAEAITAPFGIASHDPRPSILSPGRFAVVGPGQTISLEGSAFDVEDGGLIGASLEWSVDGGPALATGDLATIQAGDLGSPGSHTIRLTATDRDGNTGVASVTVTSFAKVSQIPTCKGAFATLLGTAANDVMKGTGTDDVIVAGRGKDTVTGLGGNDSICGGDGDDRLGGAGGADKLSGGEGKDSLDGGPGRDACYGDAGRDRLNGCEVEKA